MIVPFVEAMLLLIGIVLLVPVAVLLIEILSALVLPPRRESDGVSARRPRVAVLIPAHDEETGIAATLASVRPQLATGDRLLVVADNCSDQTAAVAAAAGAEVVERRDLERRGKGYALDCGVRRLEADPPEAVVMIDADCELHPGSLDRLARLCIAADRPVQALDLMHAPAGAGLKTRLAEFAWLVKNQVRPLGAMNLGLPCQLMGTGMAFPWPMIRGAPLATGHIVEDMRLGLDLAAAGAAPRFCPAARVTSLFPVGTQGEAEQRSRWERGHVGVIVHEAPGALLRALVRRRPALAAMVLNLAVPPVTMLMLMLVVQAVVDGGFAALTGRVYPLAVALSALALLVASVAAAWARYGRHVVSLRDLASAPLYVIAKLPLYARFLARTPGEWVRARRDERR